MKAQIRDTVQLDGRRTCRVEVRQAIGLPGTPGKSAFELAREAGFDGTYEEWAASLVGPSAYDEAVQAGFDGTVEEWLASLKGEQGEPGPQGPQGPEGPQGEQGPSAYDIAVEYGFDGTVPEWLEDIRGEQGPQGPQGEPGPQGPQGPQGEGADPAELDALREGMEQAKADAATATTKADAADAKAQNATAAAADAQRTADAAQAAAGQASSAAEAAQATADTAQSGLAGKVDTATYEAGQAAQDEAASALDARVTALEEGGGGGGGGDISQIEERLTAVEARPTWKTITHTITGTTQTQIVSGTAMCYQFGKLVTLFAQVKLTANSTSGLWFRLLTGAPASSGDRTFMALLRRNGTSIPVLCSTFETGNVGMWNTEDFAVGDVIHIAVTYVAKTAVA